MLPAVSKKIQITSAQRQTNLGSRRKTVETMESKENLATAQTPFSQPSGQVQRRVSMPPGIFPAKPTLNPTQRPAQGDLSGSTIYASLLSSSSVAISSRNATRRLRSRETAILEAHKIGSSKTGNGDDRAKQCRRWWRPAGQRLTQNAVQRLVD